MSYIPFSVGAPVGRWLSSALLVSSRDRAVKPLVFGVVPDEAMTAHTNRWAVQDGDLVAYLYDPTRERYMKKLPIVFDGCQVVRWNALMTDQQRDDGAKNR